jgi:hypothetical protein
MLPFAERPWARPVAAIAIVVTLIAAVWIPLELRAWGRLDLPIMVGIVLLVLAIVPPNIVILRHRPEDIGRRRAAMYSVPRVR